MARRVVAALRGSALPYATLGQHGQERRVEIFSTFQEPANQQQREQAFNVAANEQGDAGSCREPTQHQFRHHRTERDEAGRNRSKLVGLAPMGIACQ